MLDKIKDIIIGVSPEIDPATITESTDLVVDLGWTSLDMMGCVVELEEAFGKSIPDDKLGDIHTVGDIITLLS